MTKSAVKKVGEMRATAAAFYRGSRVREGDIITVAKSEDWRPWMIPVEAALPPKPKPPFPDSMLSAAGHGNPTGPKKT